MWSLGVLFWIRVGCVLIERALIVVTTSFHYFGVLVQCAFQSLFSRKLHRWYAFFLFLL